MGAVILRPAYTMIRLKSLRRGRRGLSDLSSFLRTTVSLRRLPAELLPILDQAAGLFPASFGQRGPCAADRPISSIGALLPIAL